MKKNRAPSFYVLTVEFSDGTIATAERETNEEALALVQLQRDIAEQCHKEHGTTYTVTDYRIVPIYAV